jgi:chemotaxis regulatin CheY-phosphate phosphatase CheZ
MATKTADELLYDSEATLRLVDGVLDELRGPAPAVTLVEAPQQPGGSLQEASTRLLDLPQVLMRAYQEINSVLHSLRQSRDILERTTVERLQHTKDKLREVTSATEVAATDIMDAVDRALGLVDQLEAEETGANSERAGEVRSTLRDELFGMMGCLQFQDITTQQINYASSVLVEMEDRLSQLARIFDPKTFGLEPEATAQDAGPAVAFDPAATTSDAEKRQALVDEIFITVADRS